MQHGIPAVMFITWPDMWYHSSQDTPDKQDPTQYKRAAAVGTGALAALASGPPVRYPSGDGAPVVTCQRGRRLGHQEAAEDVHPESRFIVSADPDEQVERIRPYVELGFTHLVFHAPGPDQATFLKLYGEEILPRLRAL